ncbi:MAG: helix-turn-helix transcriptional regulator [Pelolinea sp.]|nr:helix-turn-helix transcriptional regulator [Pelolinea sp.]
MANKKIFEKLNNLTGRQREVLQLYCQGKGYAYIAEQLFITNEAVRSHMANIYVKLGIRKSSINLRRKMIFEHFCPALRQFDFEVRAGEPIEPEPAPEEVVQMVEADERDLVVIEPIIVNFPPIEEEQPQYKPKGEEKMVKQIKPKNGKKKRRFWRWMLFIMIIALIAFGGMQVYVWARGFINDVVQPIINQNIPEQSQPQPQVQVVPTDTIKSTVPTPAPAQQVAVPTSTSQPTAPPQPKILFSDNFDAGLSSGWQVAYGNPIIVNGVLSTDQDTLLIVGDTSWRDYAVEFDADAGDCWLSAGENWVSVRNVDTDNNYAYKWEDCESYWYVVKNGSWNEIPKSEFSPGYDTLRFKVQVQGGNMSVYVDGTLMASFFDNGYSQGRVILKISENTTIDNFVIKELE